MALHHHLGALVAGLTLSGCQVLQPVEETVPGGPEAWLSTAVRTFVCGQLRACGVASAQVSCDDLVNEPAIRYGLGWSPQLAASLDAGRVHFDAAAARQCEVAWSTQCGDLEGCVRRALQGTLGLGETCGSTIECARGSWCDVSGGCPGRCAPLVAEGVVTLDSAACASHRGAQLRDGGVRCYTARAAGEACTGLEDELEPVPCEFGLTCLGGKCAALLPVGAPCEAHDRWTECDRSYCDPDTRRCARLGDLGEPCGQCLTGLRCDRGTQTCVGPSPAGGSCDGWRGCAAPFACENAVCVPLGKAGAACSTFFDCESPLRCGVDGKCGDGQQEGDACSTPYNCGVGLGCRDGRCVLEACFL